MLAGSLAAGILLLLTGCMTVSPVAYSSLQTVVCYPLIDARADKSVKIQNDRRFDFSRVVSRPFMGKQHGCNIQYAIDMNLQSSVGYADLKSGNRAKLMGLNQPGAKYALFICLHQWEYVMAFSGIREEMEGFLVRTDSGAVVWNNRFKKDAWLGLAGGPLLKVTGETDPANLPLDPVQKEGFNYVLTKTLGNFPILLGSQN